MTKIEKRLSIIFSLFAILWCCLIFWYSSRVASLSDYDSSSVFDLFLKIFYPKYRGFSDIEKLVFQDKYMYLFRKLAHFTEYAILGFFIYPALLFLKPKAKQIFFLTFLFPTRLSNFSISLQATLFISSIKSSDSFTYTMKVSLF